MRRDLPILDWSHEYDRHRLEGDLLAAVIVAIMLIPQSLAYAPLAGLPPEVGLYASIPPLIAYADFGTSRALAVGPVAVVSLMTAAATGRLDLPGPEPRVAAALVLAVLSGLILLVTGLFRLGFLANVLSQPVKALSPPRASSSPSAGSGTSSASAPGASPCRRWRARSPRTCRS